MAVSESGLLADLPSGLYVDGEWRSAPERPVFGVEDPATGEDLGVSFVDAGAPECSMALDAAVVAQADWAATAPRDRSELLRASFELLHDRSEEFALAMTLEMGKPLAESRGEVNYGAEFFRWFSEEAVRIDGRYTVAPGADGRIVVTSRPVGPSLLITPWNFPLAMLTRKIAAAAAAGCTMVCKPSEITPITAVLLFEVLDAAGFPPGVCNLVTTTDAPTLAETMVADPRLRKVSFTGSTRVGRWLHERVSDNLQRVALELGGNAPFIVFDDADVDAAVEGAMAAKMRNGGEACTSANRFVVHESVTQDFTDGLAERMSSIRLGRGTDQDVQLGPMIRSGDRDRIAGLVEDAVSRGARVVTGGEIPDRAGWFYPPTVLADVPADSEVLRTEIFGPVAPVVTFSSEDEAIAMANDTDAGLVSYVYTRNLDRAIRVSERLEAGMVGVNRGVVSNPAAPFGGVKSSGLGREGGSEGIDAYLETQYLGIALGD